MFTITVQSLKGQVVVDSRLVAEGLGLDHSDWMQNVVKKYQTEIEQDFGVFRFQNGKPQNPLGGRPEIFIWLTEDQATVLMTYSRNTDQVRACKRALVKAFSQAKKQLINQQSKLKYQNQDYVERSIFYYFIEGLINRAKIMCGERDNKIIKLEKRIEILEIRLGIIKDVSNM